MTYTYDAGANGKGRRTGMTDASGSTAWTYDARGRMLTETKVISGASFTTSWTYNPADLPASMTYPDGETLTYTYNSRMLLQSVTGTDTYVSSILYDSAGRITRLTRGTGTLDTTYTYYPWTQQGGRLQNLTTASLQNLTYTYDPVGNITQIADTLAGETHLYTYDALDRLTAWTLNGVTETYTYNPATGNLENKAGMTLQYNDAAHIHAVTSVNNQSSVNSYQYDPNGNQTTRTIANNGQYQLLYDAENRLIEVKKDGTTIAQFTYDGDGNRVAQTLNGVTTYFAGAHFELTGSQVTKYYFAGTQRVAMRKYTIPQSMTVEYLLGDHLGSTSITTDTNGVKVSEMRYKPWGEIRYSWTSAPATTPAYKLPSYTFTGQYSHMDDPTTAAVTEGFGLMFYNARWYDPSLGRFAQADTIIPQGQGVQAWDRYAYVNNNPVRYNDPSGHKICDGKDESNCRTLKGSFSIHLSGGFTSAQKKAIRQAVEDAGYALWGYVGNSPWEAFRLVMGNVNFVFDANRQIDGWAITEIDTITFDNSINTERASVASIIRTVVHELGHVFDVRTGLRGSGSMWTTIYDSQGNYVTGVDNQGNWVRTNTGYRSSRYPDQMHPADKVGGQSTIEEFADMFMNWVYDSFAHDIAGQARFDFMTTNMVDWISSAIR